MVNTPADAGSTRGALLRGSLRVVVFVVLALVFVWFDSADEPTGNRVFLWAMAGVLFAMAGWGLVETWREIKRVSRRT